MNGILRRGTAVNGYLRGHALDERSRTPFERHLNAFWTQFERVSCHERSRTENPLRVEISTEGVEYVHFSWISDNFQRWTLPGILWKTGWCRSANVPPNREKLTSWRRRRDDEATTTRRRVDDESTTRQQNKANTGPTPDPNYKREPFATHSGNIQTLEV